MEPKIVGIDKTASIADDLVFILETKDSNGCLKKPYKINQVTIYFISRDFNNNNVNEYDQKIYDKDLQKEYNEAKQLACDFPTQENIDNLNYIKLKLDGSVSSSPFFFKEAMPVKIFGGYSEGVLYPAWLDPDSVPPSEKEKVEQDNMLKPLVQNNAEVEGKFILQWSPLGQREGDYFICWNWQPNLSGDSLSAHFMFGLLGNSKLNTAIPTHYTNPEKYKILMERYLPEMFKSMLSDSDLSPKVLQELNLSVAKGFTFLEDFVNQTIDLLDANVLQEQFLPLLSNLFNLNLKSNDSVLWRRQIKKAIPNYKKKGTIGGLKTALADAGVELLKLTKLWQVISKYTYQESFVVSDYTNKFKLSKAVILPINPTHFELWLRINGSEDWQQLNSNYIDISTDSSSFYMDWIGQSLSIDPIELELGDEVRILYQFREIPSLQEENLESYIRSLDLIDQRDLLRPQYPQDNWNQPLYPPKNWNTKCLEEDDPLFDLLIPVRHPLKDPVIWGKVRTEFPYSENAYNMEEYNGCCIGSTLVVTENGIKKIKDIKKDKFIMTEFGFKPFEDLKNQGRKETLKIKTNLGKEIIVTPNHKFKTFDESGFNWKCSLELKENDYILCKRGNCNHLPKNKGINKNLWYLAGHLYGDGTTYIINGSRHFVWLISERGLEIKNYITSILEDGEIKFKISCITKDQHQKYTSFNCNEDLYKVHTSSTHFSLLDRIIPKFEKKGRWKKSLPSSIWESGEEQICYFLKGIFDTDGGIQKRQPVLTTKWKNLAQEIQILLLTIGIISSVTNYKVSWKGKKKKYYRVRILGKKSRELFEEKIGFESKLKSQALNEAKKLEEKLILESDRVVIPFGDKIIKSMFLPRKRISKINKKNRTREEKRIICLITRLKQGYQKTIPDNVVFEIYQKALEFGIHNEEFLFIKNYIENGWFFERVKKISVGPLEEVFDPLNVKDTTSYISNGIVSHNSVRDSLSPCDIDKEFIDPCVDCQGSKFSIDIEVEELSNDRILESQKAIEEYVPFHAIIHSINFIGSVNEFMKPPIEEAIALLTYSGEDILISGEAQNIFNRAIPQNILPGDLSSPNLAYPLNLVRRNLLASMNDRTGTVSGTGKNLSILLFAPGSSQNYDLNNFSFYDKNSSFDKRNINETFVSGSPLDNSNLLEILSPSSNAGYYSVANTKKNSFEIVAGTVNESPLDESQFEFRISNKIYEQSSVDITQDNLYIFSPNKDLSTYQIVTQKDVDDNISIGPVWKIKINDVGYTYYDILEILPNNTFELKGPIPDFNINNVSWELLDPSLATQESGYAGDLNFYYRALANFNPSSFGSPVDDIRNYSKIGDYLFYNNDQYEIKSYLNGENYKFYIKDYSLGDVGGISVKIYRRIVENCVGQLGYSGLILETTANYETFLPIQNGVNSLTIKTLESEFKENYLIFIDSDYYSISQIDGLTITLNGPAKNWTTSGTSVNFVIYQFINQPLSLPERVSPELPGHNFSQVIRSNNEIIEGEIEMITPLFMKILNSKESDDNVLDHTTQSEGISVSIEYKDGNKEEKNI